MTTKDLILNNNKTHIIFDLDGTICDILINWTNWEKGLAEIFSKYEPVPVSSIKDENIDQNKFVKKFGEPILKDIIKFVADYENKNTAGFASIQATLKLIQDLADKNLFIWSANSEKTAERALVELGISKLFKKIVGRESVKFQKPEKDGFEVIHASNPELPKSSYIFIGNAPSDYHAALNAGIEYINVNEIVIED